MTSFARSLRNMNMETIWHSGIAFILFLQSLGDWLTLLMRCFSFFGEEEFYLLIMPALLWCVDARLGLRVGLLFLLSASLNHSLKLAFHAPRPFWLDPHVMPLTHGVETSFGIPSGHAQNAAAVWGLIAAATRRRRAWGAAIALTFVIGLSRIYLGVHFPTDVLGGWLCGALLLWAFKHCEAPMFRWLQRHGAGQQIVMAFLFSLALVLLSVALLLLLRGWQVPREWVANAVAATRASDAIAPFSLDSVLKTAGALFGLAGGAAWLSTYGGFDAAGPSWKKLVRYVLGLVGVLVIWRGLGALFPRGDIPLAYAARYLLYALLGAWIAAGAPALFIRLRLAQPVRRSAVPAAQRHLPYS